MLSKAQQKKKQKLISVKSARATRVWNLCFWNPTLLKTRLTVKKIPKTKHQMKKKIAYDFQQAIQFLNFLIFASRETIFLVLPSRSFK